MKSCEILKGFYDSFQKTFEMMNRLHMDTEHFGTYYRVDMGGKIKEFEYRIFTMREGVGFTVKDNSTFWVEYATLFDYKNVYTHFIERDYGSGNYRYSIALGESERTDGFLVDCNERDAWMEHPIKEEQYFQQMTVLDLASEEFYEQFMMPLPFSATIEIDISDDGIKRYNNMLQDSEVVKQISNSITLLESTIRKTYSIGKRSE